MIWRAPATLAPSTALKPTPPRPTTATDWPGSIFAVLIAAPTPVSTAQPNNAARSSGRSGSIFTQGFARDDRVGRERGDPEQVIDRLGLEGEPPPAGEQGPGGVGLGRRLAQGGPPR